MDSGPLNSGSLNPGPIDADPLKTKGSKQENTSSSGAARMEAASTPPATPIPPPSPQRMEFLDGQNTQQSPTVPGPDLGDFIERSFARGSTRLKSRSESAEEPERSSSVAPATSDEGEFIESSNESAGGQSLRRHWAEDLGQGATSVERVAERDVLARKAITDSLASLLRDRATTAPLSVGLFGEWGSGKSSQINFLKTQLGKQILGKPAIKIVEFNAWEHEKCDNLSAALAQTVVKRLIQGTSLWGQWQLARRLAACKRSHIASAARQDRERLLAWLYRWVVPFISFEAVAALGVLFMVFRAEMGPWIKTLASLSVFGLAGWRTVNKYIAENLTNWFNRIAGGAGGGPFGLPDFAGKLGSFHEIRETLQPLISLCVEQEDDADKGEYLLIVVDDLDRCSVATIKLVLDAVRLVTNMPRVVTMVAVDDRIAFAAVESFFEQFKGAGQEPSMVARDYLAKVFNISISLPPVSPAQAARYIAERLFVDDYGDASQSNAANGTAQGGQATTDEAAPAAAERSNRVSHEEVIAFTRFANEIGMTNPRALWTMKQAWYLLRNMASTFGDTRSSFLPWMRSLFLREAILALPLVQRSELETWVRTVKASGPYPNLPTVLPPSLTDLLRSDISGIHDRWVYADIVLLPAAPCVRSASKSQSAAV